MDKRRRLRSKCDECRLGNKPVMGRHLVIVGYRLQQGCNTIAIRDWLKCPRASTDGDCKP